jgi:phospholipid/cholesterol/gamma-HCH transport system substrate-binding protein
MISRRGRYTPSTAGLIAIAIVLFGIWLAFFRDNPFASPYELRAQFENTANIQKRSPVRIAGVEVGKVVAVERGEDSDAAVVVMEIQDKGLPIHEDAELKIRPRIFLEGNFFVDVRPGTPESGELEDGSTIPITQTAAPVQLDQVLTALQRDTRDDLQALVQGYGDALYGEPRPGEDADQDEDTKGERAAESLNDSLDDSPEALRGTALVNEALLGTELHDLSKLIAGQQRVAEALNSREEQLKDFITNFNLTTAAFAAEEGNLRETIRLLPEVVEQAGPTLDALNASFPPTRAWAREILPGVRETPATIEASFPWIRQTRALMRPDELQGLTRDLRPTIRNLAHVVDDQFELLPQTDLAARCYLEVVLPTGNVQIEDGIFTTGLPNYKEFWQAMASLSGESQNFDGNGGYTRFQPGGGDHTISTGNVTGLGPLFGNATNPPIGTRPAMPARQPPKRRDVDCHRNTPPDLNSARIGPGP